MIRSFYIDNFKSLVNFRLPPAPHALGPFVCLVGLNGAGKSTVLQALDFVAHLASGDIKAWLERREWRAADIASRFLKRQLIHFKLELEAAPIGVITWEGQFNTKLLRCTSESVSVGGEAVLRISEQKLFARMLPPKPSVPALTRIYELPGLQYEGSTLSLLKAGQWDWAIEVLRESLYELKSLDMLSPHAMRRRAKEGSDIGYGGERLSAYLHGMRKEEKERLLAAARVFYPQLDSLTTRAVQAGWKDLSIDEHYLDAAGKPVQTPSRHVNDGLLRTLAVLAQSQLGGHLSGLQIAGVIDTDAPVASVLFDEIENGINPELVQKLVDHLLHAGPQVIVTTHSPLILNYLPDDVARQAVMLLYRNEQGHTQAARLFDLPSMQDKLGLLGPGEAYVDTDLSALPIEAQRLAQQPLEASA
ncbi:AAA family ATPase [Sphaerotilus microaerophilus]|uniref:ATPase AAA-type core domain-containing protein n=1 Tax=Sphaerotilus microaerophilus TaxID=2914710 RepID=A0ABN6PR72_9BURK|nr:ATP-binding protein [Sphaerotilus sp. FB-5]BDI06355.1 hypothetical protein CATMQ487_33250 [Sphaerotilus sp. FB-5]